MKKTSFWQLLGILLIVLVLSACGGRGEGNSNQPPELPEDADHTAEARRIDAICCSQMERVTGNVPVSCEYSLTRRWCKSAEAVYRNGRMVLWESRGK